MDSLNTLIGILLLLMAGWVISDAIETGSKYWTILGSILFSLIASALAIDYYLDNTKPVEPIEIVKEINYGFQEYDFGKVGITAFQDDFGTTLVVSCFQPTGNPETHCWDHIMETTNESN